MIISRTLSSSDWQINMPASGRKDLRWHKTGRYTYIIYGYPVHLQNAAPFDPEHIIQADLDSPAHYFDRTDGHGTLICLDHHRQELTIYTDPYRLYVLYFYLTAEKMIISDSLYEIRREVKLTVNEQAVIELSVINTTIGNKTLYQEIKTPDEGCCYTLRVPGQEPAVSVHRPFPPPLSGSLDREAFIQRFRSWTAGGIALSQGTSLALTAGLDSRVSLASSLEDPSRIHTYTHGFSTSMDVRVAARLAGRAGVKHRFFDLDNENFIREIPAFFREVNSSYEGSLNALSHAHAVNSYHRQMEVADTFLSSFGGELLRSYYLPPGLKRGASLDAMADGIRKISSVSTDLSLFNDPATVEDRLNQAIYEELKQAPETADLSYLADYYYHRRNFNSVTTRFAGRYFRVFSPYFSRCVYDASLLADPEVRRSGDLQKWLVQPAGKKLTSLLLNDKEPVEESVRLQWLVRQKKLAYYSRVAVNKLTNRWTFRLYFTDYDKWIRNYHNDWFRKPFVHIHSDSGVDPEKALAFTNGYLKGDRSFAYYKLLTNLFSTLHFIQQSDH